MDKFVLLNKCLNAIQTCIICGSQITENKASDENAENCLNNVISVLENLIDCFFPEDKKLDGYSDFVFEMDIQEFAESIESYKEEFEGFLGIPQEFIAKSSYLHDVSKECLDLISEKYLTNLSM